MNNKQKNLLLAKNEVGKLEEEIKKQNKKCDALIKYFKNMKKKNNEILREAKRKIRNAKEYINEVKAWQKIKMI